MKIAENFHLDEEKVVYRGLGLCIEHFIWLGLEKPV
jgi:hypothetical protein